MEKYKPTSHRPTESPFLRVTTDAMAGQFEIFINAGRDDGTEAALEALEPMAADGLVELDDLGIRVTSRGRFFLRNLCMPFDSYLAQPSDRPVYSRTV